MTIEFDKNKSTNEIRAEMLSLYYCRAKKSDLQVRQIVKQHYLDYCSIYQKRAEHRDFNSMRNTIINQIKSASLIYFQRHKLPSANRGSIMYVYDHIHEIDKPSLINKFIKMIYEATISIPDQPNHYWE
ncbi:MAG: hypothetical protein WCH34_03230 [Bacteroidota bacterium]